MIASHNQALIRQLKNVARQIDMAIEDAEDDFHQGIAHAEIALVSLKEVVAAGKAATVLPRRSLHDPDHPGC